ncbi:hypothetical protein BGW36DRAFT_45387 [Talaromyces proteolyticus]|uniref:Zn(2)-C6 fungal-type domain-containing protein n=1 Tax=Talaromyces proteolyticus TaxID=1131652 RepID=A0AAD4KII7_9EURO|nr:uncharacterized protein BGW36DRAFT_45387 [Talaromyces proteolyticus]KAH8692400.1 hypothetical protein BGW36DRAFT_45387 [Talaromyces proteolyticus]
MVGVSGRSRACANCKSRHIKCDEARPSCNRCVKAGLNCRGYERMTKFVDETLWTRGKHSSSIVSKKTASYPSSWNSADISKKLDPLVMRFLRGMFMPHNVDFTSWHYSPSDGAVVRRPFLPGVTLQALALSLHGKVTRNQESLNQAVELYGFSIRSIRADLRDENAVSTTLLISSVLHMTMYEWVHATNTLAWKHHAQALARMVEMRGPYVFKQGIEKRLFLQARSMILIAALEDRKRTFLAEDIWQTVPWSNTPELKTYINRYVDLVLFIPSIMEDLDILRQAETEAKQCSIRDRIRTTILSLHKRLLDIRCDWEIITANAAYEAPPQRSEHVYSSVDETGSALFTSLLGFKDLQTCVEMGMYHVILFFLRDFENEIGMEQVNNTPSLAMPKRSNPGLKFPHELMTVRDIGIDICRSVEFFLQPSHGLTGAYFLIFPLRVAQFAFELDEDRAIVAWTRKIMRHIGDTYGFSTAYAFCGS